MYAKAGIADYWIVNLVDDAVEVHRNPVLDPSQPSGYRYGNVVAYRAGESISPLIASGAVVAVSTLLP
jgi:Uma2 family endonuclease